MNFSMEKNWGKITILKPHTKKKPIRMGYFQIIAIFVCTHVYDNKSQMKIEYQLESGGMGRIGGRVWKEKSGEK